MPPPLNKIIPVQQNNKIIHKQIIYVVFIESIYKLINALIFNSFRFILQKSIKIKNCHLNLRANLLEKRNTSIIMSIKLPIYCL